MGKIAFIKGEKWKVYFHFEGGKVDVSLSQTSTSLNVAFCLTLYIPDSCGKAGILWVIRILFHILLWRNAASFLPVLPMVPPRPPLLRRLARINHLSAKRSSSIGLSPTNAIFLWNALLTANALLGATVLRTAPSTNHSTVPGVTALPVPAMDAPTGVTADLTSIPIPRKMPRWITRLPSSIPGKG